MCHVSDTVKSRQALQSELDHSVQVPYYSSSQTCCLWMINGFAAGRVTDDFGSWWRDAE